MASSRLASDGRTTISYLEDFETYEHAQTAVFAYIEVFANRQRCHSAHGDLAPLLYEQALKTVVMIAAISTPEQQELQQVEPLVSECLTILSNLDSPPKARSALFASCLQFGSEMSYEMTGNILHNGMMFARLHRYETDNAALTRCIDGVPGLPSWDRPEFSEPRTSLYRRSILIGQRSNAVSRSPSLLRPASQEEDPGEPQPVPELMEVLEEKIEALLPAVKHLRQELRGP